jgi:hypothetical protein
MMQMPLLRRSSCFVYVSWFNGRTGMWPTWEPGSTVSAGDVGKFTRRKQFVHPFTLRHYGIDFDVTDEMPSGNRMYASTHGLAVDSNARVGVPGGGVSTRVKSTRNNATLLQVRDTTTQQVADIPGVLAQLKAAILSGKTKWRVDQVVVLERIRAAAGFAAISTGTGQVLEFEGAHSLATVDALGMAGVDLRLASTAQNTDFELIVFTEGQTPIFSQALRIRKTFWSRMIPFLKDNWTAYLGEAEWSLDELPWNLDGIPDELASYDPENSEISPGELASIPERLLFEEVWLPESVDVREQPIEITTENRGEEILLLSFDYDSDGSKQDDRPSSTATT